MTSTIAVFPAMLREILEPKLPSWLEPRWFRSRDEALALATEAKIGWFDMYEKTDMANAIAKASEMVWLNSIYAGVDGLPLDLLRERGVRFTNGVGINAITIAEYVIMGMLAIAKGYRQVVRAQDARNWLYDSPGKVELYGSRALIIGYGAIGQLIEKRLKAFEVEVSAVRRSPSPYTLSTTEWRSRLGEFDWIIMAVPATAETDGMFGAAEFAAMKSTASIVNIARGSVIDQNALITALRSGAIAGAFLDVTTPEPLPPENPLWQLDNAHITMHLSGRAQDKMVVRSIERFLENLDHFRAGRPLSHQVDLSRGY